MYRLCWLLIIGLAIPMNVGAVEKPVPARQEPKKVIHGSLLPKTDVSGLSEKAKLEINSVARNIKRQKAGSCIIFYGRTGTGKTLAAAYLATNLGAPLYRVDLSSVVSKYIGETEKNLSEVFDAAGSNDWVLFFDEADALFGKRTEVKDAHDRYANIDSDYLARRLEEHDGVVILTTNMRGNIRADIQRQCKHKIRV